jgi:putative transposase
MPRKAREKSRECIYHIICRSVSEFLLFRDNDDKDYYLGLLKRYKEKYKCSIYSYCIMDSHFHLHLDPRGYDVSKFMQCTNLAYVRYYNLKYKRHGPVFQDRFESRILDSDEYNLTVSAYIHNNPKDIEGYSGREWQYPYSSYSIYLGQRSDLLGLVDMSFVMGLFNTSDKKRFAERYGEFVSYQRDIGGGGLEKNKLSGSVENEYRSGREIILREHLPGMVVTFISNKLLRKSGSSLILKSKKGLMEYRAICAYSLRVLCGMGYKEICSNIYNMTVSGCSRLCNKGYELISSNADYERIFRELAGSVT